MFPIYLKYKERDTFQVVARTERQGNMIVGSQQKPLYVGQWVQWQVLGMEEETQPREHASTPRLCRTERLLSLKHCLLLSMETVPIAGGLGRMLQLIS